MNGRFSLFQLGIIVHITLLSLVLLLFVKWLFLPLWESPFLDPLAYYYFFFNIRVLGHIYDIARDIAVPPIMILKFNILLKEEGGGYPPPLFFLFSTPYNFIHIVRFVSVGVGVWILVSKLQTIHLHLYLAVRKSYGFLKGFAAGIKSLECPVNGHFPFLVIRAEGMKWKLKIYFGCIGFENQEWLQKTAVWEKWLPTLAAICFGLWYTREFPEES